MSPALSATSPHHQHGGELARALRFAATGPESYRKEVPSTEVHALEAGHFALDTAADEIADLMRDFLQRELRGL